ncbi:ankyrin repeat and protein kinase domain-containing protein 1 isoform X2 [Corythoichthys intestinalis]|uniref:ankyrin repeat and protein kinase domain-containing protein 1 isoform X2 n=1 Tax=Corythoichthys intestinalis TaxID=161448 RepID=UPI0025A50BE3|nr:ankyrin repeat and protein kinase domain-containing protein 1 isoform X2 [Corythoichthys intestinalis]
MIVIREHFHKFHVKWRTALMDYSAASTGQLRVFKKNDFENDWTRVAEGKFSNVYQVKIKIWRETFALKVYDTTDGMNHLHRKVMEDVSNIVKVKFKYIVAVYGKCNDVPAIVMEYMSNGSLGNLINNTNLMWPKKFQMIHEISMGMNFLHSLKPSLFHLNLKPSNILLDDHLHVKISDFGLIHWEAGTNKKLFLEHLTVRGNINYVPPEIFSQSCDPPGFSFDVYSFGIIIWVILTQQKPYTGRRPCLEIIPEHRPFQCGEMINIMKQCWDQDENKRPPFSETVRHTEALSEVLKIPGPIDCHKSGANGWSLEPQHPCVTTYEIPSPELPDLPTEEQSSKDRVLSLLLRKNFGSFRTSVKREHVSTQFIGTKSLLHYTVASGDAESVEHVLSLGAEVNCVMAKGYTPLIVAVLNRFHDIMLLLLEHGADPRLGDDDQWSAIHFASQNGDDRAVRLLLDKGALADACEKSGWMPLHLACQNGYETVVRLLLTRLSVKAIGEQEKMQERTPLHLAAAYGHINITKLLLSQGANPNATDCSLSTPLHLSAEAGHNRIVRQLVQSGAAVDIADKRGHTPLHLAALNGHKGICRQLLTNGASPDCRTHNGWTAMHLAAIKRHETTMEELKSLGANVNAPGENQWTPLHLACQQSEAEMVARLLAAQADPNVTESSQQWTPLHLACASLSFPSVLRLISHHANVNAASAEKATPLHLAAQHGNVPIVKALLLNGADRTLRDSSGSTPAEVAQRHGKYEIVQLLEE